MHILILPSWYPQSPADISGCFFREQAIGLVDAGHKVAVLTTAVESKNFRLLVQINEQIDEGIVTRYLSYPKIKGIGCLVPLFFKKQFWIYCQQYGAPDLIHVHSVFPAGLWALAIKNKYNIPYCITEHSTAFPRRNISQSKLDMARVIFNEADVCMAVSSALARSVNEQCRLSLTFEIVPNFLHKIFDHGSLNLRKKNNRKFRFLNVALLSAKKGQAILIETFAEAFRGMPVELYIGGDGEERNNLEKLIVKLGVSEQVKLLGKLSREAVKQQMDECDVFVLSSFHETFGVVIIEALSCGKPVIATQCGGPEEILNNITGILVKPGSRKELGCAMKYMRSNYSQYDSEKIRDRCLKRFSQKTVINKLEKLYEHVLVGNKLFPENS